MVKPEQGFLIAALQTPTLARHTFRVGPSCGHGSRVSGDGRNRPAKEAFRSHTTSEVILNRLDGATSLIFFRRIEIVSYLTANPSGASELKDDVETTDRAERHERQAQ